MANQFVGDEEDEPNSPFGDVRVRHQSSAIRYQSESFVASSQSVLSPPRISDGGTRLIGPSLNKTHPMFEEEFCRRGRARARKMFKRSSPPGIRKDCSCRHGKNREAKRLLVMNEMNGRRESRYGKEMRRGVVRSSSTRWPRQVLRYSANAGSPSPEFTSREGAGIDSTATPRALDDDRELEKESSQIVKRGLGLGGNATVECDCGYETLRRTGERERAAAQMRR
ncbi:hypothetical protein DFH07DRAFT_766355 [Mycena maculata]|uniref:Uncharacterized protein n=1 Tax=Mycena maculata TaxID=230809 RepID=A0AAD7K686_9AGAR|nr:hypothetical protein DFH07DRAFT_766355 [Mycena maculata]